MIDVASFSFFSNLPWIGIGFVCGFAYMYLKLWMRDKFFKEKDNEEKKNDDDVLDRRS